jgi:integrase
MRTGKARRWSKSIGERGHRVRFYEARPGGPLMRSIYVHGREDRKSLGHRDKEAAVKQGYELLTSLLNNERVVEQGSLTLGILADLYLASPAHASKKLRGQKGDERKIRRVTEYLGASRNVDSLSESDVRRFVMARRKGDGPLPRVEPGRPVSDTTVSADLIALSTALNWAVRERTSTGRRLLRENPLFGIKLPREKNPRRPVMTHDEYLKLLEVANQAHPLCELGLIVAEGTGRRISSWRNLQWDDVDFTTGAIRWRAEHDKKGYEMVVPMSEPVRSALAAARRAQQAIGSAPVFPAPKDPARPCDRHILDAWLRKAYAAAKLTPKRGGLWHTLRRKWATERKGYPIKDLAAAGGWRDDKTLLASYLQADAETVRRVVLHPTQRLVSQRGV